MKNRRICLLAALLALALILPGCGKKAGPKPDPDQVALEMGGGEGRRLIKCPTVASLMEVDRLVCVVYGEVVDISYYAKDGGIYTTETIRVLETLYGDVQVGEELPVWKSGGYMVIADVLESSSEDLRVLEQKRLSRFLTDEEIDTQYKHEYITGNVDAEIGDRSIFFLEYKSAEEGLYKRIAGSDGEYVEMKDGCFLHPEDSYTPEEIRAMMNGDEETMRQLGAWSYTYDEMVDMINAAMK